METVLVLLIVGFAIIYLLKKFYRSLQKTNEPQGGCGCGCTSCSQEDDCNESPSQPVHHTK